MLQFVGGFQPHACIPKRSAGGKWEGRVAAGPGRSGGWHFRPSRRWCTSRWIESVLLSNLTGSVEPDPRVLYGCRRVRVTPRRAETRGRRPENVKVDVTASAAPWSVSRSLLLYRAWQGPLTLQVWRVTGRPFLKQLVIHATTWGQWQSGRDRSGNHPRHLGQTKTVPSAGE